MVGATFLAIFFRPVRKGAENAALILRTVS
jgi:hypothetical protein